jgi:ribosomal protein L13
MQELRTWAERSKFQYSGSIEKGTKIEFGNCNRIFISGDKYKQLLNHFNGRTVNIGTSRTDPPRGSAGEWLMENVTKAAIASYVGSILIHERYAEKAGGPDIRFFSNI